MITDAATGLILASGSGAQVDLDNATIVGGTLKTSGTTAFIETVSGSTDALVDVAISSGSTIEINAGSVLTIGGKTTNSGILLVNGGTLDVAGTLTGGTTEIGGTGRLEIAQASSENVDFLGQIHRTTRTRSSAELHWTNIRIWNDPIHRSHGYQFRDGCEDQLCV